MSNAYIYWKSLSTSHVKSTFGNVHAPSHAFRESANLRATAQVRSPNFEIEVLGSRVRTMTTCLSALIRPPNDSKIFFVVASRFITENIFMLHLHSAATWRPRDLPLQVLKRRTRSCFNVLLAQLMKLIAQMKNIQQSTSGGKTGLLTRHVSFCIFLGYDRLYRQHALDATLLKRNDSLTATNSESRRCYPSKWGHIQRWLQISLTATTSWIITV